ncbi:MAG: methyl-accepting chemotaxis protein [Leptospiraceae bacterium]|nr:methyl-accepting chemotaxis protein [Leptospiraceae bacterium]MCK6381542.1 methyl-accepting chemotaxis protein [Leptospiraceae bacterium]NUM41064.1 methyl-accepting chemotaxis protein [Leptospiraceae bacterium]
MRKNLPVTKSEIPLSDHSILISKTNLKGVITYANEDFVKISGYTKEELEGQPHNILRHPDMPPSAFKDLWDTIKRGEPWFGFVKNRTKNGDYYWVDATVTASYNDAGEMDGYVSVRKKMSSENISKYQAIYDKINRGEVSKSFSLSPKKWILNMKISSRLSLLSVSFFIFIILFTSLGVYETKKSYDVFKKENDGAVFLGQISKFTQGIAVHRGMTCAYLAGDKSFEERILEKSKDIDRISEEITRMDLEFKEILNTKEYWGEIVSDWNELKTHYSKSNSLENFKRHAEVISKILLFAKYLGNSSELILEPDPNLYYYTVLITNIFPYLSESEGQMRALGAIILNKKINLQEEEKRIRKKISEAEYLKNEFKDTYNYIKLNNPNLSPEVRLTLDRTLEANEKLLYLVNTEILDKAKPDMEPKKYFDEISGYIHENLEAYNTTTFHLENLLQNRISNLKKKLAFLLPGTAILVLSLFYITILTHRSITNSINNSIQTLIHLTRKKGNVSRTISIESNDEISLLGKWINVLILNFVEIIYYLKRESQYLIAQSEKTVELVTASNESTQSQAASTEETSAASEELHASIENVVSSILQVSKNLKEMNSISQKFKNSQAQMSEIVKSLRVKTDFFSEEARKANESTNSTIEAIKNVDENAKKIDNVVTVINEISDRTNLLALNAAIEAARAGEYGKGFAVVAQEISKLADQTAQNTKNIQKLVSDTKKSVSDSVSKVNTTSSTLLDFIKNIESIKDSTNIVSGAQEEQILGAEKIVNNVQEVSDYSESITEAANQQKIASTEIIKAIQSITIETQNLAAGSHLLMDTAKQLESTGKTLLGIIKEYNL